MAKLTLLADSYDQPLSDEPPAPGFPVRTKPYSRGDEIVPRNQDEHDRLIEMGAAEDPQERNKREQEQAQARIDALQAEKTQLDERIRAERSPKS